MDSKFETRTAYIANPVVGLSRSVQHEFFKVINIKSGPFQYRDLNTADLE